MIRNIIFDIGNVLAGYDWQTYLHEFHFDSHTENAVADALFRGPLWKEYDRGALPVEDLKQLFIDRASQYENEVLSVFENAHRCISRKSYARPWLLFLKERGFNVYYLSNYSHSMVEKTREALDFLPLMDGGLFSYEVKQVKPEPEIYRSFFARYPGVLPKESVFIDDTAINIKAAQMLGMHGIVFHTQEQAEQELDRLITQNA